MNCISIKRVWSDETMIELEFSAKGINISSKLNFYTTEDEISELKEKLIRFPSGKDDSIEWIVGSKKKNCYAYFKCRIFLINTQGHVAIEIEMDNKLETPYTQYSHFYIPTEVASINGFGKSISNLLIEDYISIKGIVFRN